jgi:tetratricopeptide (TPR) repeat protein
MEAAMPHLRRAGHPVQGWFALMLAVPLAAGPRPASEALATIDAVFGDQPYAGVLLLRALLLAMLDRLDEAWAIALPAEERLRELGLTTSGEWLSEIAVLAGDYEAAAGYLRDACASLEANGNFAELSTYAPARGRALCALGRFEEAEPLAIQGRDLGGDDDLTTQVIWREVAARVKASRGDYGEAESLAREAIEIAAQTDCPGLQADARCDFAEVLEAAGRRGEAVAAWREALDRYERKEMIPLARRVRERLAAIQPNAPGNMRGPM